MPADALLILGLGLWLSAGGIIWAGRKKNARTEKPTDLLKAGELMLWAKKTGPVWKAGLWGLLGGLIWAGWLLRMTDPEIWWSLGIIAGWTLILGRSYKNAGLPVLAIKTLAYLAAGLLAAKISVTLLIIWALVWVMAEIIENSFGRPGGINLNPAGWLAEKIEEKTGLLNRWQKEAAGKWEEILNKYGQGIKAEKVTGGQLYNCPVCGMEMEEIKIAFSGNRSVIADRCPKCAGVRFDQAEQALVAATLLPPEGKPTGKTSGLACPRCNEPLNDTRIPLPLPKAIWLVCDYCRGYFIS